MAEGKREAAINRIGDEWLNDRTPNSLERALGKAYDAAIADNAERARNVQNMYECQEIQLTDAQKALAEALEGRKNFEKTAINQQTLQNLRAEKLERELAEARGVILRLEHQFCIEGDYTGECSPLESVLVRTTAAAAERTMQLAKTREELILTKRSENSALDAQAEAEKKYFAARENQCTPAEREVLRACACMDLDDLVDEYNNLPEFEEDNALLLECQQRIAEAELARRKEEVYFGNDNEVEALRRAVKVWRNVADKHLRQAEKAEDELKKLKFGAKDNRVCILALQYRDLAAGQHPDTCILGNATAAELIDVCNAAIARTR